MIEDSAAFDDLDAVLAEAKAFLRERAENSRRKAKTPRRVDLPVPRKAEPTKLFSDPANWYAARHVALIHQETQTLLGHFREMLHRTVPDCRRLVREEVPATIEAVEYVTGDWGYKTPAAPVHTDSSFSEHLCSMFVEFEGMRVGAVSSLRVILQGVGILRVETIDPVFFGSHELIFQIPAGTNIFPVMSVVSKKNLRAELENVD